MKLVTLASLLTCLIYCADGSCNGQYNQKPARFFVMTDFKANWMTAWNYCRKMRMYLAHICSEEEHNQLVRLLVATEYVLDYLYMKVWLSGTRPLQSPVNTKHFVWSSTGESLNYTHWSPNEPNNKNENEGCLEMVYIANDTWSWNDFDCDKSSHFVCRY